MNEFRADLHCHTTISDGTLTPEEVLHLAKEVGLSGLSITDHDTVDAYKTIMPLAESLGIEIIAGVEFSAMLNENSVHILGYSFNLDSPYIHDLCRRHHERRKIRNLGILSKLAEHDMYISEEEMNTFSPIGTVGRPHIAQALISKGYVGSVQEAFEKYLGEGKQCHMRTEHISVEETIDVIHKANGYAIIAHPHLIHNTRLLKTLLKMPFDGIECYYGRLTHAEAKKWIIIARERNWLITGGSDFHGEIKPYIGLGISWVGEELFRKLQK